MTLHRVIVGVKQLSTPGASRRVRPEAASPSRYILRSGDAALGVRGSASRHFMVRAAIGASSRF